ncbi:hypothetical protein JD78_00714 [Modestobacter roseus]|uniref:Pyridoxamine 5'-phosphate oxidase-like protein n=3 Tax=Modestobacter roseus TaxID=1181884 RepID=A0A562IMY4_9ACTN|nr:pyridoxamine 5'-phosphate oxidase family protein [Modestobacter roseus]TWH72206.1 hypothetical protein JD78_00714 [Modestobacter roseus]
MRAAGLAELVWRRDGGPPGALGVVPLLLGERPAVALPWAQAATARSAAGADAVALVLSDPRLTGSGWEPLVLSGRPTLLEDGDGALFTGELLAQELRKHPPSRALADSAMLRREHWWYLPRLVLVLDDVRITPTRRRDGPADVVLAVDDGGLHVGTARVGEWGADPLVLEGAPDVSGPATLVGQEVSVPDAERWTVHETTGWLAGGQLSGVVPAATRELEPTPGLLARVRRQRALHRACVAELRAAGRA